MADPSAGHADHDPLLIVAFLDRDLPAAERGAVETLLATCPDCAALHADLVSLAIATRDVPTPVRPRDFRLTTADAARLAAASGEPGDPASRLAGVMTERTTTDGHPGHDTMLVASLADHSLAATERTAAEALVASCGECTALHADLLALRDATRAMPTPPRPRDFTLTNADAARLRPGGWRRLVAAFGSSRDVFSRPLAAGLTTLGLAGLLLASVPSMLPQSGATSLSTVGGPAGNGAGQPEAGTASSAGPAAAASAGAIQVPAPALPSAAAAAAPSAAASAAPNADDFGPLASAGSSIPPVTGDFGFNGAGKGASAPTADDAGGALRLGSSPSSTAEPGVPWLVLVSGAFLVAGLALFAIRWSARRLGDG